MQFLQQHRGTGLETGGWKVNSATLKESLPKSKEKSQLLSPWKPKRKSPGQSLQLPPCPVPSDIVGDHETTKWSPGKAKWDWSLPVLESQTRLSPDSLCGSNSPKHWSPNYIRRFALKSYGSGARSWKAGIVYCFLPEP